MKAPSTDESALPARMQPLWQRLAEVLLIVLVFFIVAGDVPPQINEAHYLSRLKHYWDPTWCANDFFLESKDTQLLFIWLFGWLTRFTSLTVTAWIGRAATWALIAWAWQRLSWRVVPRPLASMLSAALFVALNSYAHMAGEWIVGGVEAKCFAFAFVLFALGELMDGRWNLVWLMLGIATAFHPLVGGWSGVVCVGIWLLDDYRQQTRQPHPALSRRERVLKMWPGFLVGGAIALVGILPALTLTWGATTETVAESNRIYVFERLPHHLAPLTVPQAEVVRRLGGHAILLLALLALCGVVKKLGDSAGGSQSLDPSHPARAGRNLPLRDIAQFAWGAALIAGVGLMIELVLSNQPIIAAKLLRYYWFRLTDFAAAMAVALYIIALISAGLKNRRKWALPLLLVAIGSASLFLADAYCTRYVSWAMYRKPLPVADNRLADYPAWVQVCNWAAANTPVDALFITPRLNQSFKWRAGRAEVANRKDLPQDAGSIVAWSNRMKDLFTTHDDGQEINIDSVCALGTQRVKELAEKYHAQFVLSDRAQLLELPIVFQNEEYVVYRIKNRIAGNSR